MKTKIILAILTMTAIGLFCCDEGKEKRKIKLTEQNTTSQSGERFTSTIHLEPAIRRAIAVMFFENRTGDQNLEWLQKGLTEMFIRSLSQTSSLSVLSTDRIFEILKQAGQSATGQSMDMELAAIVAREANVEAILTGNISRKGDSLQINIRVHEPNHGKILRQESVEGKNLEAIFTMVDDLTQKIKNTLALSLEKQELAKSIADLSTNSLDAWRHYAAGVDFQQQALVNEAVEQFKQAVAADPTFVAAYYQLCLWLLGQGEREKAREYFDKLKSLRYKATPKEQYQIDRLEGSINRDLRQIIDASQKWLQQNPNDIDAYFNLGDIYFALQNYDQALGYYRSILKIDPKFKLAHNQIGYCHARMGQLDSAVVAMNRYQAIAPDEPNPFDSMGEIYLSYGQYQQAEQSLRQSLKINENFLNSWLVLSNVYLEQGQHRQSLRTVGQFLTKAATPVAKADGYAQMGFIQWRQGNMDAAIDYFQKFVTNRLASYRAATWVYELYLEKGDSLSARKSLLQNYEFIRDSLVAREPIFIRDLANFSLWYDVNVDETIEIIQQTLVQTTSPAVQMWGQFYLAVLYLKTNRMAEYHNIAPNFTTEITELMKDIREVPFAHETWKSFWFFNQYAYQAIAEGAAKYGQLIEYCTTHDLILPEMIFRLFLADLYFHQNDRMNAEAQL
ncbi:MAG: tetratricopeptide repeat protein, partial [candidate division KSB1 bacterium]|nr:tetratricopeptide repeat protein [candidate division KSB1 bacterium]